MKVLWITNLIFPAPSKELGIPIPSFGGWMFSLFQDLQNSQIEIAVASIYHGKEFRSMTIDQVDYYLIPNHINKPNSPELEEMWKKVYHHFRPDLVHLHGSEYPHGYVFTSVFPEAKFVVSIQGLVSVYEKYYKSGLSNLEILFNISFYDIVRNASIFQGRKLFEKKGQIEKELIRKSKHVIGRTNWDAVHVKTLNPLVHYHFCNESLRVPFYQAEKWSNSSCFRYSIFLSQASYPIKGLHQVIKAIALLKEEFPLIKINVAGSNIIQRKSFLEKIKFTGYGKYIGKLVRQHGLENHLSFLGILDTDNMVKAYQNANVFICPSSIENSPNSVGEAQLLGVPTIASYSGGVPDMIKDGESGLLYRFEEVEMLADCIRRIFNDQALSSKLSEGGIEIASFRHNRSENLQNMMKIYSQIWNEGN
ncbi:glycosyltransferase family 4 protein [Aquirufa sp. ROCK2-A2]